jgi:hypothetical protein
MQLAALLLGSLIVLVLVIGSIAVYMIDAESFEFTTSLVKVLSLSIKVMSPRRRRRDS